MSDESTTPELDLHDTPVLKRRRRKESDPDVEPKVRRTPSRRTKPKHFYRTPEGAQIQGVPKFFADILKHWYGSEQTGIDTVTVYNPENPRPTVPMPMGEASPICQKCLLFEQGCKHPFFEPKGPRNPVVTVVYEGISTAEDDAGELVHSGTNATIRSSIERLAEQTGVLPEEIRWVPMTRCASRKGIPNYRIKGNWCRYFLVQDLLLHPPRMIIPVGTAVLGLLSHKSNAQDWQGRILTYRGWPDDWLTNPAFVEPRPNPVEGGQPITGHPVMGPPPEDFRIPMVPIITTKLAFMARNQKVHGRWRAALAKGLTLASKGFKPNVYTRPWYRFVNDPEEVMNGLLEILEHPGLTVCYDTETTGLKPLARTARIVSMMFRWVDPKSGNPRSLGFPWNFVSEHYINQVKPYVYDLTPLVLRVLTECRIVCHNATFDMLYSFFNLPNPNLEPFRKIYAEVMELDFDPEAPMDRMELDALREAPDFNRTWDANLCAMAQAFQWDTWHMAFALRQERGSLGLELLAYDYAPSVAGYEEEMTLLIERKEAQLFPGAKDADPDNPPHYLNISEDYYPSHVIPYVMGDVEVCYQAREVLQQKLDKAPRFRIPLADPARHGHFRLYMPPSRAWVYEKVISPSARTLMQIMARGMHVDEAALTKMEMEYPVAVAAKRDELRNVDQRIIDWCEAEERKDPDNWELDLENKNQLRDILFTTLKLPVQRFTKQGRKLYGETPEEWAKAIELGELKEGDFLRWAAIDKFTLNKLAVDYPEVRPLQEYRQLYKLYTTYVRPLRNTFNSTIDKKDRTAEQHLCWDHAIHASFLLTGTRGGRLSCRDPNLQQLPNKGDVKQLYTSRFRKRGCMYQSDLSQIELRLMASACGDPTMLRAYRDKLDLHTLTTSRIYKLPYEHFSKEHFAWLQEHGKADVAKDLELKRRIGKTVNFLTGYGGGAFGLQTVLANNQLYKSIEECEEIIDAFFDSYPSLQKFLSYYKRFIEDNGCAVSLFGRVRIFDEVYGDDNEAKGKALRAGCNHVIQSTAADMMLIALNVIEDMMRKADLESILVSTVHDSLLIDAVRDELPQVHNIVFPVLNHFDTILPAVLGADFDTSWMLTPFAGDCEVGHSYYSTRKIPETNIDWDKLLSEE